jgi:hypothetical protein
MIRAANNARTLPGVGQALDQLHLKNLGDKEGRKNYVVPFEKGGPHG